MTNTDSRYRRNNIIKRILTRIPLICFCTCGYLYGSNDGDIEIYKKYGENNEGNICTFIDKLSQVKSLQLSLPGEISDLFIVLDAYKNKNGIQNIQNTVLKGFCSEQGAEHLFSSNILRYFVEGNPTCVDSILNNIRSDLWDYGVTVLDSILNKLKSTSQADDKFLERIDGTEISENDKIFVEFFEFAKHYRNYTRSLQDQGSSVQVMVHKVKIITRKKIQILTQQLQNPLKML